MLSLQKKAITNDSAKLLQVVQCRWVNCDQGRSILNSSPSCSERPPLNPMFSAL